MDDKTFEKFEKVNTDSGMYKMEKLKFMPYAADPAYDVCHPPAAPPQYMCVTHNAFYPAKLASRSPPPPPPSPTLTPLTHIHSRVILI